MTIRPVSAVCCTADRKLYLRQSDMTLQSNGSSDDQFVSDVINTASQ